MRVRPLPFVFALTPLLALAASAGAHEGGAHPGQCFGRTVRAPVVEEHRTRQRLSGGHWRSRRTAARYAVDVRRTLLAPTRLERVSAPAAYRTTVRWEETPSAGRRVHIAPTWRSERVQVVVEPAHAEWRPAPAHFSYAEAAPGQTSVQPTGEVLCRVWCPAKVEWRERRVVVSPGGWTTERAAPSRRRIVERELVRPARMVERRIPARYRVERTSHLVQPGRVERVWVPSGYRTVVSRRVHGGGQGWSQVVCPGPLSNGFRANLQGALNARGYDAGPPNGAERAETYHALRRFQRDHRMGEGQVTVESARALGVLP